MPEQCENIKADQAPKLSNPAKILLGYMRATGITDAKQLAAGLDIPLRTIQRLKLECASVVDVNAKDANDAISGVANDAKRAISGVFEAPNAPDMAPRADSIINITNTTQEPEKGFSNEKPKKAKPEQPGRGQALEAFEAYNATALACGLPQAARMTPDRERRIIARLKDYGLDGWRRALTNVEHSAFLTGGNDRGFRADLDFLLQAKSFSRAHDGGYGNGRSTTPQPPPQTSTDRILAKLRAEGIQ